MVTRQQYQANMEATRKTLGWKIATALQIIGVVMVIVGIAMQFL